MKRNNEIDTFDDIELKDKIRKYYLEILERDPDQMGLENYFNKIKNKEILLQNLPIYFKNSPEYLELQKKKLDSIKIQEKVDKPKDELFTNDSTILKLIDGHKVYLNPNDEVLMNIFGQENLYEKSTLTLLKKLIKKGMNVINIGANIGYVTLLLARLVGPSGKVFAFEPSPETSILLQKNVEINGYKNVEIHTKAISNKTGKAEMWLAKSSTQNIISSKEIPGLKKASVDVTTIDNFLMEKKIPIDFIMMDAEGSEKYILEGLQRTLEKNPNMEIITEYNPFTLKLAETSDVLFLDLIEKLGFFIYLIDENEGNVKPITKKKLLKDFQYPNFTNLYLTKNF